MNTATAARDTLLYLNGVTVSFDGFRALNELSLIVEEGELRTIIGPNGAGKTTMMDVVTGKTRPDAGEVFFRGTTDLSRLDEVAIANLGIGRKFQRPTVFENLTVLENLELSLDDSRGTLGTLFTRLSPDRRDRIYKTLARIGLSVWTIDHGEAEARVLAVVDDRREPVPIHDTGRVNEGYVAIRVEQQGSEALRIGALSLRVSLIGVAVQIVIVVTVSELAVDCWFRIGFGPRVADESDERGGVGTLILRPFAEVDKVQTLAVEIR